MAKDKDKVTPIKRKLEQLESGDVAQVSGLYVSSHPECKASDVWVRRDHQLPVCLTCGKSATFTLEREILHISEDSDFQ